MGFQVLAGGIRCQQQVKGLGLSFPVNLNRQRSLPIVISSRHTVSSLEAMGSQSAPTSFLATTGLDSFCLNLLQEFCAIIRSTMALIPIESWL